LKSVAFQTRARTIDHLGREQIADIPTAISELWKNAYDAYAREAALHIFDGEPQVAAVVDDGHGMSAQEFIEKWLVVGTESKAGSSKTPKEDRNGLPERPRQGQKGIGRLSCAALGNMLLLISKRRSHPFVASLIDWRLFQNPYLTLSDIEVPVVEFDLTAELPDRLSEMFDALMTNLWGDGRDPARDERIAAAWAKLEEEEEADRPDPELDALISSAMGVGEFKTTKSKIEETVLEACFSERHFDRWKVWANDAVSGTALFVSDLGFDLTAQLPFETDDPAEEHSRDRLFKTLSNFGDPFATEEDAEDGYYRGEFKAAVTAWQGGVAREIISSYRSFKVDDLNNLEFVVDGIFDDDGVFVGKVKAYGEWLEGDVEIRPSLNMPVRSDSRVGPFRLRLGSWLNDLELTTHTREEVAVLNERAERYSGLMVHRDGLRVLPYGREDNDFFEIEKERSKQAGRWFWSNRRTFGRVAISRRFNPNLRDKAGREGLIDNRAAKTFRDLVKGVLRDCAYRYFGSDADLRKAKMPEIKQRNLAERAKEQQSKQRSKMRSAFRKNLKAKAPQLEEFADEVIALRDKVASEGDAVSEDQLLAFREAVSDLSSRTSDFALGEAPRNLRSELEEQYRDYRDRLQAARSVIAQVRETVHEGLKKQRFQDPRKVVESHLAQAANHYHSRIRRWRVAANELLESEKHRINELADAWNKKLHDETAYLLDDASNNRLAAVDAMERIDAAKLKLDAESSELFEPYLGALESLQESIDLETLASYGMDQVSEMREELDRLNSLAQLGIAVEIIGHEFEALDQTVRSGLQRIEPEVEDRKAFNAIVNAHETLTERLRFLAPLKLSGERANERITGAQILDYLERFFNRSLRADKITLSATAAFRNFNIHEQRSRLYPVFLNLVNNARYWVTVARDNDRQILLDADGSRVFVADDGPGVDKDDASKIFSLFFTRRSRGGRGVGLYLCRVNLAAGGHAIRYTDDPAEARLPGANFVLEFRE